MPDYEHILDVCYRALHTELGLSVKGDPARIRSSFYAARATDPELSKLGIFNSPYAVDEFFIVKREVLDAYRQKQKLARKENDAVSSGGLGIPDSGLSTEGPDDFSFDP